MTPFCSPLLLRVILLREGGRVPGHEARGALELLLAEDGDGWDEECELSALDDGKTTSQADLEQTGCSIMIPDIELPGAG